MTEAELMNAIAEAARVLGWRVAHFRPGRTAHGWRTAVAFDGKGWPDLAMVRERLLLVEVKTGRGKLSPEQEMWVGRLRLAGCEVYTWREADWTSGAVDEVLKRRDIHLAPRVHVPPRLDPAA